MVMDNTTHNPGHPRGRGGRGAHARDISTRRPTIKHRGESTSHSFGGVTYFSYNHAPPRRDRLQVLTEPKMVSLMGFTDQTGDYGRAASDVALGLVPALRQISRIWAQAYEMLRELAQDRDGYRHLPGTLNHDNAVELYVLAYMYARMLLVELTSWQKLSQYDDAHILAGIQARKVSRGRVNGLWESLSQYPIFPGFSSWADRLATPVSGNSEEPVYHPQFPVPLGLRDALGGVATNMPYEPPPRNSVTALNPTTSGYYTNLVTTVETLLEYLSGHMAGMFVPAREDNRNLRSLLYMLSVPQAPQSWTGVTELDENPQKLDAILYRGAYIGAGAATLGTDYKPQTHPTPVSYTHLTLPTKA